ncbi:MAG: hypothetical protein HZR80_17215 [Candidatus Heimdallarchaeota archaeon]
MSKDIHEKNPEEIKSRIKELDKLLQDDPKNIETLMELSSCYRHIDYYDETLKIHNLLISLDPQNVDYHFMKGIVLVESSREDEVIEIFDAIIDKNPQHRDALFNKGLALKRLGKNDESKAVMKKAHAQR